MGLLGSYDLESGGTLTSYGFTGNVDTSTTLNNVAGAGVGGSRGIAATSGLLLQMIHGFAPAASEGRIVFDYYPDTPFGTWQRIHDAVTGTNQIYDLEMNASYDVRLKDSSAGTVFATFSGLLAQHVWINIDIRFRQRTPGNSDGSLQILIGGALVYSNLGAWGGGLDSASRWDGCRWQGCTDTRYDNLVAYDSFDAYGGVGSEATFANATLAIGECWMIVTCRSGAQYVWSDRPLPDPASYYLGWKEPRVIQWGQIRRALSHVLDGQYETSDFTVTLSDTDRLLRGLDDSKELVNATVAVYMIDDAGRRALQTPFTIYRGVIRDAKPTGTLQYELTIKDTFAEQFSTATSTTNLVPQRTVTTDDFPNAGVTLVASSAAAYVVDGNHSAGVSQVAIKNGYGLFAEGSKVTFAGDTSGTTYSVSSPSSCFLATGVDAETYIAITPALAANISDGAAVTNVAAFKVDAASGKRVPIVYGFITDRKIDTGGTDDGDGQGPLIYVGDRVLPDGKTYAEFLWAGHACYSPSGQPFAMIYFWNEALDDLAVGFPSLGTLSTAAGTGGRICMPGYGNWSTTNGFGSTSSRDYNGRRYTVLYLRGIFRDWALGIIQAPPNLGGIPCTVNAYGCEDVGDGSGALISDGLKQYKHIVKNWCPPKGTAYQGGAWLSAPTFADDPTLSMIDEDSFDAAHTQSTAYVTDGFRGDFIIGANDEAIAARDLLARLNLSFAVQCGFNRKTQFFVNLVNRTRASLTLQPTLTYVRDIFSGTFEIAPQTTDLYTAIDYRHTQDYLKREADGWRSVETGTTESENTSATAAYGAKTVYATLDLYMVRGKNRSTDADDYARGSDTAAAVVALTLARLSWIQHIPAWQTGPGGFSYELAENVPITHYEGLGSSGWTDRPIRLERVSVDPSQFTTTLEGYDLDPILT